MLHVQNSIGYVFTNFEREFEKLGNNIKFAKIRVQGKIEYEYIENWENIEISVIYKFVFYHFITIKLF